MKLFAIILMGYFGFLTASPAACDVFNGIVSMECSADDGCNAEQPNEEAPCAPCCSVECCTCVFYIPSKTSLNVPIAEKESDYTLVNENALSSYLSECWKPPQAA